MFRDPFLNKGWTDFYFSLSVEYLNMNIQFEWKKYLGKSDTFTSRDVKIQAPIITFGPQNGLFFETWHEML